MTALIHLDRVAVPDQGRDATILVVTLDRPDAANAINPAMSSEFCANLLAAHADAAIGAVVVTGRGARVFCAGADLKMREGDPALRATALTDMLDAIIAFDKPLVCAVNGVAAGGGAMLALLADRIFMAVGSRLVLPEIDIGMPTPIGLAILTDVAGSAFASDLVLSGRSLSAEEAGQRGLALLVRREELLAAAIRHAAMLASKSAGAFAANKDWLRRRRQPLIDQNKRGSAGSAVSQGDST